MKQTKPTQRNATLLEALGSDETGGCHGICARLLYVLFVVTHEQVVRRSKVIVMLLCDRDGSNSWLHLIPGGGVLL